MPDERVIAARGENLADIEIAFEEPPSAGADLIWEGLKEHNRRVADRPEPKPFALVVREGGVVRGGIKARVHWDVLFVDEVWLDDGLRGQGLGAKLMAEIERLGAERGAIKAILDTNDWQAPGFYAKLGYARFGAYTYDAGRKECILLVKEPLG